MFVATSRYAGVPASVRVGDVRVAAGVDNCWTQNETGDMFEKPRISVPFVPLGIGAVVDLRANRSAVALLLPDVAGRTGRPSAVALDGNLTNRANHNQIPVRGAG